MERNEKTALKTSKNEFGKRYTAFQIFLNGLHGNKNLNSELFIMKKQNNIQASSGKEFNISKKEKKWILFCTAIVNLSYTFLWGTFVYEYQIINDNNVFSFYHLFFIFHLLVWAFSSLFFLYGCDYPKKRNIGGTNFK